MTPAISFEEVSKHFGSVKAVDHVSLEIADGEFFSMLGPSGSGKTTCLRLVAGFEQPTSGRIFLSGADVVSLPPHARDVNTVFQDYALFPHMTVGENVAYGLAVKKVPEPERSRRTEEALALVRLEGLQGRKPAQLSGGQRQRVAVARALVNRPRVLLLDEPLGALDLKLRQAMQVELKEIQREVGVTFIYVTHDQEEALSMSDRLAVFNLGRVEQVGSPAEVYEQPANLFVAGFVGVSNQISGALAESILGHPGSFTVRPEKIRVASPGSQDRPDEIGLDGLVREATYLGPITRYLVELPGGSALAALVQNLEADSSEAATARGRMVRLAWKRSAMRSLAPTE